MKKNLFTITILLLSIICYAESSQAQNKNGIDGIALDKTQINNILNASENGFIYLKGSSETNDEFNFGDAAYTPTCYLSGASKCELYISRYMPEFAIRLGANVMTQNEAFKLYDYLFDYLTTVRLAWGISKINFNSENESGKVAEFSRDPNIDLENKFVNVTISIKTKYISDDQYQVHMFIIKSF